MILLAYDGSPDAQAAIDHAALLMPGAETTVLTIWEPFVDMLARSGSAGMGVGWYGMSADDGGINAASERSALETAQAGAQRATAAGLIATPRTSSGSGGLAPLIIAAAADVDADVVVMGSRGLGGVKSFLLGSVSHGVVQHADRPVLVVPSPTIIKERSSWARHTEASPAVA